EVIWAAMMEGREKIPLIRKVYGEGDLERYQIEVHGLKNAMKSIGANYLSQLAGEQEQAAKMENYAVMKVGVEELLEQYQIVVDALAELLGE
ncbi:MAG: hypothetical protein K2M70_10755, partial [Lachnospiraceae bacterium]|nr:hypothetical protein [Lachnospiraceae bacterium]